MVIDSRLEEFLSFVDKNNQLPFLADKKKFYEELYEQIEKLENTIQNSASYKSFLITEDKIAKLQAKILELDQIEVEEGLEDMFEGIKYILKAKVLKLKQMISTKKFNDDVVLYEERPRINQSYKRNNDLLISEQEMERENQQIISGKEYEATRQRLKKIDVVQKAINEQLIIQDERIDGIYDTTKNSKTVYKAINEMNFSEKGSFFKRILYKVIIILTFVLIFLHLFNRK
ncbi:hypothetical protein NUSPORA_00596 [Nucleospora cyclopteri]